MKILFIFLLLLFVFFFRHFFYHLPVLLYWKIKDAINPKSESYFPFYGCWFFVGRQGSGKSISLTRQLLTLKEKYPEAKIYTNYGYEEQDAPLTSLNDLLNTDLYNGEKGTIFAIDEIQNEFSCASSKDFPETLLSVVTQQRKNHVLILCTSQVFSRISKPLREQAFRVIECSTYFGRYTTNSFYDGTDYCDFFDKGFKIRFENMPKIKYKTFVQNDKLRSKFDSYAVIKRLSRENFVKKIDFDFSLCEKQNNF